jgi:hypothetical protein
MTSATVSFARGSLGLKIVKKASEKKEEGILPFQVSQCGINIQEHYAGGRIVRKNVLHDY